MKNIFLALTLIGSLILPGISFSASGSTTGSWSKVELPIKMYIFGHIYLNDKNNPIGNIRVFIKKDGKELAVGKTNASGLYEILSDNRSDYVNLCMESTDASKIKGISLCEAVSVYQKLSRVVNNIELRDLEHDFYVNEKGENLNERLLKEIQNEPEDTAYENYQATIDENKAKELIDSALKKKEEEDEKERAKYRMPANTELPGPLKLIQAVGTLKVSDTGIDKKKIFVRIYTQEGKLLKERPIGDFYEFRFDIEPKEGGVFLHPLVLEIRSSEEQEFEWGKVQKYKPIYVSLAREKNILTPLLESYIPGDGDRVIAKRSWFPWIVLSLLILIISILVLRRSEKKKIRLQSDYK